MQIRWIVGACAVIGLLAADPALARSKSAKMKARAQCVDRNVPFSWDRTFYHLIVPSDRAPRPNGCSPAVHTYGRFIGQDPDYNIRFQLNRDPETGYAPL